ncbi:MAG: aminomethyl-transferring glycine dehydrogenase subunit GcvPA [Terriglobales bacterium]
MRYLPKSPADRELMLREIGIRSIDELFAPIPAEYRLKRELDIAPSMAEADIMDWFRQRASETAASNYANFLGAGAYHHYRPVVIDTLISRGEFFTAYTPYQPEIAQGTLQAIFEFQTMICELAGMEVANASMYDGSTATTEAAMMAARVTGRHGAVVARSVHPEYREVLASYAKNQGMPISEVAYLDSGRVYMAALEKAINEDTAGVLIQSPNFFGTIEDVAAIAEIAHRKGALLVVAIAEAMSLGIVKPPQEADIVAMEAQSFGVPLSFGGPYAGVIASKEKFVRQMPGRLVGQTQDKQGRRGFVLTLSTREQHIRREKATSNICTNQALIALMATVFMTVYGREGLKELAVQNLAKTAYAVEQFGKSTQLLFQGAPRFNEFVVQTADDPKTLNDRMLDQKIIGGLPLKKFYPELGNASLWCCTELTRKTAIDAAARGLSVQGARERGVLETPEVAR